MSDPRTTTHADRAGRRDQGVAPGAAFLGWLTATGAAIILTTLVAGIGAVIGLAAAEDADAAVDGAIEGALAEPGTTSIIGALVLAAALFTAYVAGGYVAGRMARVSPALQGVMVWVWAVVFTVVVGLLAVIGSAESDVFARTEGFPFLPLTTGELTTSGIVIAVIVAVVALGGAILGSVAAARTRHNDDPSITH